MRIVDSVRVHTGFPIETQLFRCKRWIIKSMEDALPEQHAHHLYGYNALPEPYMAEYSMIDGFVSLTDDPYELHTHDALIDTLNLQLLNALDGNIQESLTYESKMGDIELQRRMTSWLSKYGLPWGKTQFDAVMGTGDVACLASPYGPYNLSNLEDDFYRRDMHLFEVPLLVIAHELAKIEMLARTLLNHEDFDNVDISTLFQPKVTYSILKCNGDYAPILNAANILDAMRIQILHLAQYGQGDPIKFCKCCGGAFRPAHGKQDYCLSPCNKDMASKRRTRARSKEDGRKA